MNLAIEALLSADEVAELVALLAEARFREGRETAGPAAAKVKTNMQGDPADPRVRDAKRRITAALVANPLFLAAARPARLSPLLISRCREGQGYGLHIDDAIMRPDRARAAEGEVPGEIRGGEALRADVAFTVFLSAPDAYEGGALVIEGGDGERAYRLPAGAAIVYPATTLHRVETVTRGERLVAAGWAQSLVRAADHRELLFDLEAALADADAQGAAVAAQRLRRSISNLLRMWAEP